MGSRTDSVPGLQMEIEAQRGEVTCSRPHSWNSDSNSQSGAQPTTKPTTSPPAHPWYGVGGQEGWGGSFTRLGTGENVCKTLPQ